MHCIKILLLSIIYLCIQIALCKVHDSNFQRVYDILSAQGLLKNGYSRNFIPASKSFYKSGSETFLIKFTEDTTNTQYHNVSSILYLFNGKIKRKFSSIQKIACVYFPSNGELVANILASINIVEHFETDNLIYIKQIQKNAPWGLWRLSKNYSNSNTDYVFNFTGKNVTVYILDSGVDSNHKGAFFFLI